MNQLTLSSQHHCKVTYLVTWQPQSFCFPPSSWWKKIFWFLHSRIYSAPEFVGSWSSAYRSESHSVEWSDLVWPLLNKYIYFFFFFFFQNCVTEFPHDYYTFLTCPCRYWLWDRKNVQADFWKTLWPALSPGNGYWGPHPSVSLLFWERRWQIQAEQRWAEEPPPGRTLRIHDRKYLDCLWKKDRDFLQIDASLRILGSAHVKCMLQLFNEGGTCLTKPFM